MMISTGNPGLYANQQVYEYVYSMPKQDSTSQFIYKLFL